MDAFELLKADHKKVADLFDQLDAATGIAKLNVFGKIKDELELHTHVEETIFYPALEGPEETHDLTLEAYEEHRVVKALLTELAGAKEADDEWQAKAKVLRESVEHHVDEEENELFDKADDALSSEQIEELGTRMAAEKAAKQGRPLESEAPRRSVTDDRARADKPGILSRLANAVGLGSGRSKKGRASKKPPARKRTGTKSAAASKGSKKAVATKASKKKRQKSPSAIASKSSSVGQSLKRVRGRSASGGTSTRARKPGKKAAKKRVSRN